MPAGPPTPGTQGASLSDLLTAAKNLVVAVNNLTSTYQMVQGKTTTEAIIVPTILKSAGGFVARIFVTTAGSTTGLLYDSALVGTLTRPIYVIPDTLGAYSVYAPTDYGILIVPGTGQAVAVSWA